jgi:YVTN family beta-propeller protein
MILNGRFIMGSTLALLASAWLVACGDDTTSSGGGGEGGEGGEESPGGGGTDEGGGGSPSTGGSGGNGGSGGEGGEGGEGAGHLTCFENEAAATRGDALALSRSDDTLVIANRDTSSVTVMSVAWDGDGLPELSKTAELGVSAEPWEVALEACGERAFVISRKEQEVVVIEGLPDAPVVARTIPVGSEPTGLALSPDQTKVWVANWVDGTVSVIDVETMLVDRTIDLNAPLAATGFLGSTLAGRPALAHPRSVAVSEDGTQVVVTEFFAQRTAPEQSPDAANADVNWVGLVYVIDASNDDVSIVELGALPDTGYPAAGTPPETGCFPNQLQGVTIHEGRAYVPSVCASPRGPTGVKLLTHPVVSVVDLATKSEVGDFGVNLNKRMDDLYAAAGTSPPAARKMPLLANKIVFDPASGSGYVSANGVDAVYRFEVGATGAITSVGDSAEKPYIDLTPGGVLDTQWGMNPIGLAAAHTHKFVFAANDVSRNVSALDIGDEAQEIAGASADDPRVIASTALPVAAEESAALRGKRAWNTGTGRFSQDGQGWGSCQSCHFEGLSDNVTWYFARGPRQATSTDGSFASNDPTDQRIFNWTAVFDEIADFENVLRGIDGGVGAIVHTISAPPVTLDRIDLAAAGAGGLNGSATLVMEQMSLLQTWADVEVYVQGVRSPRAPANLDPALVAQGEEVFEAGGCAGCHGGAKWTLSKLFYTPSAATNAALLTTPYDGAALVAAGFPDALLPATAGNQFMRSAVGGDQIQCVLRPVDTFGIGPADVNVLELRGDGTVAQGGAANGNGYNVPSILGMQVGAPYFHAGNARTLEELLDTALFAKHATILAEDGFLEGASAAADRAALVQYLLSIDESTPIKALPATAGAQGGSFCAAP